MSMPIARATTNSTNCWNVRGAIRVPSNVRFMGPFAWAEGAQGIEKLEAYIDAGCQRFMLQFTDYDNLEPIEAWAAENLQRFR